MSTLAEWEKQRAANAAQREGAVEMKQRQADAARPDGVEHRRRRLEAAADPSRRLGGRRSRSIYHDPH